MEKEKYKMTKLLLEVELTTNGKMCNSCQYLSCDKNNPEASCICTLFKAELNQDNTLKPVRCDYCLTAEQFNKKMMSHIISALLK